MTDQKTLLHLVADYGPGDLAFAEVWQRLRLALPRAVEIDAISTPPLDDLAHGFVLGQLAETDPGAARVVIFGNCAPRAKKPAAGVKNAGEPLRFARLKNGVEIFAVDAGFSFSFLREKIAEFRELRIPADGSQFRSRDVFPAAIAGFLAGDQGCLGEKINPAAIPEIPPSRVAYLDGYGNLKTTLRRADLPAAGERVSIAIGGRTADAFVGDAFFRGGIGELVVAPGSSGPAGDPFVEITRHLGSAAEVFGLRGGGAEIELARA